MLPHDGSRERTGHTWFYRGCRECRACRRMHPAPEGMTEADLEQYRYAFTTDNMPWGYDTADPTCFVDA